MTATSSAEQAAIVQRAIVIATRVGQATPGPWGYLRASGVICAPDGSDVAHCLHDPDALFLAHARADMPWLLGQLASEQAARVGVEQRVAVLEAAIRCANAALNRLRWQSDGLRHLITAGTANVEVMAAIHAAASALDPETLGLKDCGL
jgi:hypothetical protein